MNPDNINTDDREIKSLSWGEGGHIETYAQSPFGFFDKIEPYYEPGQMAEVPWFRIMRDGVVLARVNAAHVRIVGYSS